MLMLIWPLVLAITVVLYVLILITLPFNQTYATLFLFALIGYWSRLPGVGIPHPFYILYLADFVDLFSLIVAINIGGIWGGIFSLFGNLVGRISGVWPVWGGVLSDSFAQFFTCLVIPFVHVALGGNILNSMIAYTIIRVIFLIPLDFAGFYRIPIVQYVLELIVGGFALLVINITYAKLFGSFFDNLLKKGVHFSWLLFLFATVIIFVFYISVFSKSKSVKMPSLHKMLRKAIAHRKIGKKRPLKRDVELEEMRRIREMMK